MKKSKKSEKKIKTEQKNKKILIDGGAGFIGGNLASNLLEGGHEVYVVDNLITGRYKNIKNLLKYKKFHFYEMNICDLKFKNKFFDIALDEIYHLACPTGVPNIKKLGQEMLETCSTGTYNVMEIAKKQRAKVLFSSSAEIYGQAEQSPQKETYNGNVSPIGPRSAYEEGKRFSESVIKMYADKYDLDAKIARIFNAYGPGMSLDDQRVLPQFLKSIYNNKELTIFGDGEQKRTFVYIDDLLKGLKLIMSDGDKGEAYNVGGEDQITIKNLARLIRRLKNYKNGIQHLPHFIEDHAERQPSLNKIHSLGWSQKITLKDGVAQMIKANGL